MVNAKVLYNTLLSKLLLPESAEEINAIALATLQHLGISRTDILAEREVSLNMDKLDHIVNRLNQHEPLQYIFNEAWFYGRNFFVDNNVLIPRPETELLIDIAKESFSKDADISVLDIGTGSGCIAITCALEFTNAKVTAIDISGSALQVAKKNAQAKQAPVSFIEQDILQGFPADTKYDLILSNPPYIAHSEMHTLPQNVLLHEPHMALFAAQTDALIFYRAIAKTAFSMLRANGILAVEINERYAHEVLDIFKANGFSHCHLHHDVFGKHRVISAHIATK